MDRGGPASILTETVNVGGLEVRVVIAWLPSAGSQPTDRRSAAYRALDCLEGLAALGLDEETERQFLNGNAERVFGID